MARFGPKCPFLGPKKLKKLPFRAVSPKIPICTWAEVAKFSRNAAHGIQLTILRQNKAKKIGQVKKCRNNMEHFICHSLPTPQDVPDLPNTEETSLDFTVMVEWTYLFASFFLKLVHIWWDFFHPDFCCSWNRFHKVKCLCSFYGLCFGKSCTQFFIPQRLHFFVPHPYWFDVFQSLITEVEHVQRRDNLII